MSEPLHTISVIALGCLFASWLVITMLAACISFLGGIAKGYLLMNDPDHDDEKVTYSLQ